MSVKALKEEPAADLVQESLLEQLDRLASTGTLVASVAHEANDSLSYVTSNLRCASDTIQEMLATNNPPNRARLDLVLEFVAEAESGVSEMARMSRALISMSRPPPERLEVIDVRTALELPVTAVQAELRNRARFVCEYNEAPAVRVSTGRLEQVFLNLLLNAAQAIRPGRADVNMVRVSVWAGDGGSSVIIEVQDTGCGIASKDLPRIFEPFFTTKYEGNGTGLGLAIAYDIVSGFGGRIEVETELGRGSIFRVILPAAEQLKAPAPRRASETHFRVLEPDQEVSL
jgi:signal transduction histidine kinase